MGGGGYAAMNLNELRSRKDSGPYDTALENNFIMYDNLPYVRDVTICNKEYCEHMGGNIIKYYRCKLLDKKRIIEFHG